MAGQVGPVGSPHSDDGLPATDSDPTTPGIQPPPGTGGDPDVPGTPGTELVRVFILQGHLQRTALSCDGGRTWVADKDQAPPNSRCWEHPPGYTEIECDHQTTAGRGVAFGNGWFVSNFGWGPAGAIFRSRNGIDWTSVKPGENYAATVFVDGRFIAISGSPVISDDNGASWRAGGQLKDNVVGNVRQGGAGHVNGAATVVMSGDDGLAVSLDRGETWESRSVPKECRGGSGIRFGNGSIVLSNGDKHACVSTDRGGSWMPVAFPGSAPSHLVWTGTEFMAWGWTVDGTRSVFRSTNGLSWTTTPTRLAGSAEAVPSVGTVTYSGGVLAAANDGWGDWYERQRFYRSEDGVTWELLAPEKYTGSHPVRNMASALVSPEHACR